MKSNVKRIGIIGAWHLGCVYGASLAKLGYAVSIFDYDKATIQNLQKNIPPIHEPDLPETLKKYSKHIHFITDMKELLTNKDYIFITFDLPVNNQDKVDLSLISRVSSDLKRFYDYKAVVVVSSQVPVGTCRKLINSLSKKGKPKVIYFPENLRLGKGFETFLTPDRIVIGSDSQKVLDTFEKDFSLIKTEFVKIGLESAEMVKHTLNSYLATCISFSSEISDICDRVGAQMNDVVAALKKDKRVSPFAPLNPGLGFAGGTLGRDIQSLTTVSKSIRYIPHLFPAVYKVNANRLLEVLHKIKTVYPNIKNRKIGVLGLTYKPGTNTLRRSLSLGLIKLLHKEDANIKAYDPLIKESIAKMEYLKVTKDYNDFFTDLEMVILMTEWPEFQEINFRKAGILMKKKVMIDTKNFYKKSLFIKQNYQYKGIGTP
jgi:UDPglucose 6-dehydrogenase